MDTDFIFMSCRIFFNKYFSDEFKEINAFFLMYEKIEVLLKYGLIILPATHSTFNYWGSLD